MKSYLQNLDIECWHNERNLGSRQPEICLYKSQSKSCDSLLVAIDELEAAGAPAKRTMTFRANKRRRSCSKMHLILSNECEDLRLMYISVEGEIASVECTPSGLRELREAVVCWQGGAEDFSLSPPAGRRKRRNLGQRDLDSGELSFWGPYYYSP